jgi:ankyrin repeat protein
MVAEFLRLAATGELARVRQLLAEHPSLVNTPGPHPFWGGRPQPLHVAIESGRQPMVEVLLRAGADPNGAAAEYDYWSPLMLAINRKRGALERVLLRRGARIGLVEALMKGDDRTVIRLLKPGASALPVAPNQGSLLMFARTPKAIDRLLELGVPADTRDRWGASPIEALSRLGRVGRPLVRHLQARGIEAEPAEFARMGDRAALVDLARQDPGVLRTPAVMMGAVDFRHHALVRWLLSQGADPNTRTEMQSKQTALHSAAWNGDLPMVKLLVAAGADINARDQEYDATPLGWAETSIEVTSNEKCQDVVDWLSREARKGEAPAAPEDRPAKRPEWKPIMDAAFNGDPVTVERLLKRGADPNVLSNSTQRHRPLHRVIERKKTIPKHQGHDEVVRVLLAHGADPMRRALFTRMTALGLAGTDDPRFLPLLLPQSGNLDLYHAAVVLDLDRVKSLLAGGADPGKPDINTMTALHYCAGSALFALSEKHRKRQAEIARALVAAGGQVNQPHAYGEHWSISALYYATGYHDNPDLAEVLLDLGADPCDGESVYHAVDEGHTGAMAVLARRMAPEKLAAQATNALSGLLKWGRVRAVPWLLAHGADPNRLNEMSGDAALHAAARASVGIPTIELLLEHGADVKLKNREGKTAKQLSNAAWKGRALL